MLKVDLQEYSVAEVTESDEFQMTNNGQHVQLEGHALVRVMHQDANEVWVHLLHPETSSQTGHADIIAELQNQGLGFAQLYEYGHMRPLGVGESVDRLWPTGYLCLGGVLNAAKAHLLN